MELKRQWENAVGNAGIEDFRFHDLRHSAASRLAKSGATLLDIAAILGHKTLEVTKKYSHLCDQHTAKVLENMNQMRSKALEETRKKLQKNMKKGKDKREIIN